MAKNFLFLVIFVFVRFALFSLPYSGVVLVFLASLVTATWPIEFFAMLTLFLSAIYMTSTENFLTFSLEPKNNLIKILLCWEFCSYVWWNLIFRCYWSLLNLTSHFLNRFAFKNLANHFLIKFVFKNSSLLFHCLWFGVVFFFPLYLQLWLHFEKSLIFSKPFLTSSN